MPVDAASDFAAAPVAWGPGAAVGGVLLSTFALGFTEGCLEVERRPIPLRFALRFAAVNVLPSAVWSSVPARHVAAAASVPLANIVTKAGSSDTCSRAVGNRLLLLQSVRALRCVAGSYGLAWSLWRLYCREEGADRTEVSAETVVRLAPVNSSLSKVSRLKYGEHLVAIPVSRELGNDQESAVDWSKVGINVCKEDGDSSKERVKVVEVELCDAETALSSAKRLSAKAARDTQTPMCSVAVLPLSGPALPSSTTDSFDVCFNPLSAALTFVAEVCHTRNVTHAILIGADEDEIAGFNADDVSSSEVHLSTSQLAAGLLYRHGITATVLKTPEAVGEEDESSKDSFSSADAVFFISESLSTASGIAGKSIERGLVVEDSAYFVVEESLCHQKLANNLVQTRSPLLEAAASLELQAADAEERSDQELAQEQVVEEKEQESDATCLSIADVTDETLQAVRKMLRRGKTPDVIQAEIYQAYGTQRVVTPTRIDQFSDMNV
ncbi:hypothetical protein PHYBOEH_008146 [Phytophthora boehmeriae]|uniref:Uncharacterized protein n=1 Tax=Phytophthora boehmeriae TaxID=109152 RepID=A0A8T1W6G1_9STRA|nr:hypothetical protein PHYBOEH_008146 [Phytophthora boehmeriae]